MRKLFVVCASLIAAGTRAVFGATNASQVQSLSPTEQMLADYFRVETARLQQNCLPERTLDEWNAKRADYKRQLAEMLGLWPTPVHTDLKSVVTGSIEQEQFRVEKLHFQAMPQLYVTANFYLPKNTSRAVPAILYMCGHGRVVTNGVSMGCKAGYHHHGEWFARNGYACLILDTLQLGEIQGAHRGTHSEGQWWWNSRGYTPAGVEAWFGIRALDYLCTRPEVDKEKIGLTGRSGGGSYSYTIAALDDRVKVVAPIAGITDLQNQIVDGCVEGHCDCMFFVNKYRWDFPVLPALIAPRPLLIGNSDKDKIFPLDGVVRLYQKTRKVYALYNETNNLGLLITDGPHADTQELQLPVLRWFNRFLKNADQPVTNAATKVFAPQELKVFDKLSSDELNTRIPETFVPQADTGQLVIKPGSEGDWLAQLREQTFRGWPAEACRLQPKPEADTKKDGVRRRAFTILSQEGIRLPLELYSSKSKPKQIILRITDLPAAATPSADELKERTMALFTPRRVEVTGPDPRNLKANQVRRRFMLLGQTLDSMRVWDIRCAIQQVRALPEASGASLHIEASGPMAVNAVYAALFEPGVAKLQLARMPLSHKAAPDYLNVLKIWDIPQAIQLLQTRSEVELK